MELAGTLATWFLVFLTYSALGWVIEMVAVSLINGRRTPNRGFLIGPLCPIYGFGAIFMTLLLRNATNLVEIFVVAILGSAVLEYFTSFIMEKLFRVRWWDYSEKPFNIHGRICLENLFYFGVMGIFVIKLANPFLFGLYDGLGITVRLVIAGILFALLLIDIATSLWLIIACRVTVGTVHMDATEEITQRVREVFMDKGRLTRRLAKAFPAMKIDQKEAAKAQIHVQAKAEVKAVKQNAKVQAKAIKTQTASKTQVKTVKTQAKARTKAIKNEAKAKIKTVK